MTDTPQWLANLAERLNSKKVNEAILQVPKKTDFAAVENAYLRFLMKTLLERLNSADAFVAIQIVGAMLADSYYRSIMGTSNVACISMRGGISYEEQADKLLELLKEKE